MQAIINNDKNHTPFRDKTTMLPYFQSSLFATVLEDTITELRILAECNNELRILKACADMPMHLALKFNIAQPAFTDELAGIDEKKLGCIEYKLSKLDADRRLVTNSSINTYKDLSVNGDFASLEEAVKKFVEFDQHLACLQEDETKNRIIRRDLHKQLRQQRNHIKTVTYDTDATIDELKTQVGDAQLYAECTSRYVDNWQIARTEQHIQTLKDKESQPSNTIEYYKQRTDHEQRVHSEVEMLISVAINETLEKVEDWMSKYDNDMEDIELKIQIKKNDYQNMRDKRIELEKTIEKHDQLMKNWIQFKEEREKALQYRDKMTNSAIIVQAWWRGLLVRKQLGPFRVAKKKGNGKKK